MIKQLTTVSAFMISAFTFSQVGIDTETPQATLDVVGKPADNSVLDGIIAPRIEGAQLRAKTYTSSQTGALVYVTLADTAPAGQTIDVTKEGYYYFNGLKWVIAGAGDMVNIYNSDGLLTGSGGNRNLTLNGKVLNFIGTQQRTSWGSNGVLWQENLQNSGSSGIVVDGGNSSRLFLQQFYNGVSQIQAGLSSTGLALQTSGTTASAPITFSTSSGGGTSVLGSERMRITGEGNVGVNTTSPTEKLDVAGIAVIRELPLNGAANAHHTISGGNASATQNQTFTATKTVVADDNGVLGYVAGLPSAPVNIYTANGSLGSNRTATLAGYSLSYLGGIQRTVFNANGSLNQMGLASSPTKHANIAIIAADNDGNSIASNLHLQIYPEQTAQIIASSDATGLTLSTNSTTVSAPINFSTSSGGGALGTQKMTITGTGNVGINTNNPTAKFHVVKSAADITPAIIAGCNVYADNAAATTAGVPVGGLYRKADGTLMVRY